MKPIEFFNDSVREALRQMPDPVRKEFGFGLHLAQVGEKHADAKPLKGFSGVKVMEIVEHFQTNTYRVVYTLELEDAIWVLHAFQKKSKSGIKTAKVDIDLIIKRYKHLTGA